MKRIGFVLALIFLLVPLLTACQAETIVETVVVTEEVMVEGEEKVITKVVEATPQPEPEENWEDWETIKIGVPTLLTGAGAPMGTDIQAGITMAVEDANEAGGLLGKRIELVVTDIKEGGADECRTAANLMDRSGAVAVFPGALYGPACVHAFGVYDWPFFHASAIQETVDVVKANMPEYDNIFMTCASETAYSPNNFKIFANELPYEWPNKKVALLGGDITYDMLIQSSFKEIAEENGWEVVLDDTYPYGTTDFSAQLSKIRAEEPALIYGVITSTDSSVAFMNQFLENPTDSIIYIQWSPASPEFIGLLGDKANGILWSTLYAYLDTEENQEFIEEFNAKYSRDPGAAWPFVMDDHLGIWMDAVKSCESPIAYECINTYIENLSDHPYEGRVGTYGMDKEGHFSPTGSEWIPLHLIQIQDQKNVDLFLGAKEVEDAELQNPPWLGE